MKFLTFLLVVVFIFPNPVYAAKKYLTKSKHHIVVGDHEDIKKDLEEHHH